MRKLITGGILALSVLIWAVPARAQDSLGFAPYGKVKINFQAHDLEPFYLPFDVPFRLYAVIPDSTGVDRVEITCFKVSGPVDKPHCDSIILYRSCCRLEDGKDGVIELKTLTLKRDFLSGDTLYADVNVPLRPSNAYRFSFQVHRRVLDGEIADLNKIIDPMIFNSVMYVYSDAGNTNAGNIKKRLPDMTLHQYRDYLVPQIADSVLAYFRRKHLHQSFKATLVEIESRLPGFIDSNYSTLLHDKLFYYEKVMKDVSVAINKYTSTQQLSGFRLFRIIDSVSRVKALRERFKVDSAQWKRIGNIVMDDDSLGLYLEARRSHLEPFLWHDRKTTSSTHLYYKKNADSFYFYCAGLANQLKALQNESTLLKALSRRDRAQVGQEIETVNNALLLSVNIIAGDIDSIYAISQRIDSMPKTPPFNFKKELAVDFDNVPMGMTSADFITRSAWYMIADVGFAYINTYPTGQVRPYVGVNFSFRPVNRQAEFSIFNHPHYTLSEYIYNSLSVTVGLTVFNAFGGKDKYSDLFGTTGSLLTGISLRLSDGVRLTGGAMWAYQKDPNPVSDNKALRAIKYGSLSVDLALKKWLGGLAKFF